MSKARCFFVPLEMISSRYTIQMRDWVKDALRANDVEYFLVVPDDDAEQVITTGQFLDSVQSNAYKLAQLQKICALFARGCVRKGDIFLFGDVWFPGVEAVRMMAELTGVRVIMAGWDYAGMADPADFYAKTLGAWAAHYESMLLGDLFDEVIVGSEFHRDQVKVFLNRNYTPKIVAAGLVWDALRVRSFVSPLRLPMSAKRKRVVFPHRLAPEKQPELFLAACNRLASEAEFAGWEFAISTNRAQPEAAAALDWGVVDYVIHDTKQEYYDYLADSAVFASTAIQETFGYALHEAIAFGCAVVAPRRASYIEMLQNDPTYLYEVGNHGRGSDEFLTFTDLLRAHMRNPVEVPFYFTDRFSNGTFKVVQSLVAKAKELINA